jgi:hypothetical protein
MKTSSRILLTFAICASGNFAAGAQSLAIETWKQELRTSIETGKPALNQVLSTKAIEQRIFSAQSEDSKLMEKARLLFAKERFSDALSVYNQIPKDSPYWLEAVEEKSWAFHRVQDFEKSLAQTKTLLSEPLVQVIGSEPFFLQALSQLKICDYAGVLKSNKLFKETQTERILAIEELAKSGDSLAVQKAVEKANQFPLNFSQIGTEAKLLPRLFYSDRALQMAILKKKMATEGSKILEENAANNPKLVKYANILRLGILGADLQIKNRMKALAKIEISENNKMIQKLSLIEVETIQRIHADKDLDPDSFKKGEFAKLSHNELAFPDDGNPWLDELDKYQVKANTCPRDIRRRM